MPHLTRHDDRRQPRRQMLLTLLAGALPWRASAARDAAPALPLLSVYRDGTDPTPYLVSEKYDGVRAHWDGATLRHRSGRIVAAPRWFTDRLPATPLDGELWLGRGRFDALSGTVRKAVPVDAEWRALRYMVFELPGANGPFGERAQRIAAIAREARWPHLVAVEHTPVADRAALQRRLASTLAAGGEGLVLHRADAAYGTGRSDAMLKLKAGLDAEAVVVAHRAGQGRHAGRLGALAVRAPDGRQFLIGTGFSDAQRDDPPPPGSTITYRYRDLTPTGLPRFASFLRVHHGL